MDYQAFGQQVRARRQLLKLTQEQAASMAELPIQFYEQIECGTPETSLENLLSIAQAFGTTPDALLGIRPRIDDSAVEQIGDCLAVIRWILDQMDGYYGTYRKKRTRHPE